MPRLPPPVPPSSPLAAAFELEFAHKVTADWIHCRRVAVMYLVDEWRRLRDTYEPDAPILPLPAATAGEPVRPALTAYQEHLQQRGQVETTGLMAYGTPATQITNYPAPYDREIEDLL